VTLQLINVFCDRVKHTSCVVDNHGPRSIVQRIMNIISTVSHTGQHMATDISGFESHYVLPGDRGSGILLVCDHARNTLPEAYGDLGLPASEFDRHIAYDIGVEAVVNGVSARLGLPAVVSCFSRLLIDPNRGVNDPTLIMQLSDGAVVPGNRDIDETERNFRLSHFYRPYHRAIEAEIDAATAEGSPPVLISVHSFTPAWKGLARPWHAGFLWEDDRRCSDLFIQALSADPNLMVGDNEPYAGGLAGDTMNTHAVKRGLPHTLLEIRQDLISHDPGVSQWIERLAGAVEVLIGNDQIKAVVREKLAGDK
jgi:predicted N-formylglutamate amidohydrolase